LTVSNTGDVAATGVTPSLGFSDPSMAGVISGPVPAQVSSLSPHESVEFLWSTEARRAGTLTVTASAAGTDAFFMTPVTAQGQETVTVLRRTDEDIAVYPNPVDGDFLNVALKIEGNAKEVEVKVYNAAFRLAYSGTWRNVNGSEGGVRIDGVSGWAPGVYLLRAKVTDASGSGKPFPTVKVMVKR